MQRIAVAVLLALPFAATGCSLSGSDDRPAERPNSESSPRAAAPAESGELRVEAADQLAVPHVVANKLYGVPAASTERRLAAPVNAAFTATLTPAAVPRADDPRVFAYHAFRDGRPVIRLYDAARGHDSILAVGAFSLAWHRDGRLAYLKGLRAKVTDPNHYRGHIVVSGGPRDASRVRWTSRPGRYVVAAWAGDRLIAYKRTRLSADLVAFSGPGRSTLLARNASLVAISPDGRQAVTSRPSPDGATAELVDVATGVRAARFSFRGHPAAEASEPTTYVTGGSWAGELVVGATNVGLVVLRVSGDRMTLEQALEVDLTAFPIGLQEPRLDPSGRRITAWAELAGKPRQAVAEAALLECDRATLRCRRGPTAPGLQAPQMLFNPSRP